MIHRLNPFLRKFRLDKGLLKQDLQEDWSSYCKIKEWFKGKQISKKKTVIYSPGVGYDAITLLALYDAIVSKNNRYVEFIFVDVRDFFERWFMDFERYAHGGKVKHSKKKGKHIAKIYFKDKVFSITYYVNDALRFMPKEEIDIYYERAFEIVRAEDDLFLTKISEIIKHGGLLITDYGFNMKPVAKKFKKVKGLPKDFGLYHNFQIWQRVIKAKV